MADKQLFNSLHLKLYEDIINGKFNPTNSRYSNTDILKGLLEEAGTFRIAVLNADETLFDFIEKLDYKALGFKSPLDFDLITKEQSKGRKDIYVKPLKVYELMELIDIPYYASLKCTTFIELLGDEFERIKIRAERILDLSDNESSVRIYATKHIQKAKKLFYDSKKALSHIKKSDNPEDIYIIFAANIFLIRIIIFFQKLFRPYVAGNIDNEQHLFNEILQVVSLKRLCSLFHAQNSGYCGYIKKSFVENTIDTEGSAHEVSDNSQKDQTPQKSLPANKGDLQYAPLKWNGQINVLVDVLTQLTEETRIKGMPALETTDEDLLNFILTNFRDSDNKELSYYTINTLLNKNRTDKRLHPQSPKRIDVAKTVKRKK